MKYVALLRGINVGGNNKIEMSKLKKCFESLGYENVSTYINSGNILFETKRKDEEKLIKEIEKGIKKTFHLGIKVLLRNSLNIKKICKSIPDEWANNSEQKTDVLFLWEEFVNKSTLKLLDTNPKVDTLKYVDGAIIWHLKKKHHSKSGMGNIIGTDVYKGMTVRNVNTVRKLNMLFGQ